MILKIETQVCGSCVRHWGRSTPLTHIKGYRVVEKGSHRGARVPTSGYWCSFEQKEVHEANPNDWYCPVCHSELTTEEDSPVCRHTGNMAQEVRTALRFGVRSAPCMTPMIRLKNIVPHVREIEVEEVV